MVILVIGGSGSGKSAYAEERVSELHKNAPTGRMIYLATMEPYDEESRKRVEKHQKMRAHRKFQTMERYVNLEGLSMIPGDTVLLECVSNLMANEMYGPDGQKEGAAFRVIQGLRHLAAQTENLVIVGNNVFEDGTAYDASTMEYIKNMAQVQREAASLAHEVVEVVCGIPIQVKGGDRG